MTNKNYDPEKIQITCGDIVLYEGSKFRRDCDGSDGCEECNGLVEHHWLLDGDGWICKHCKKVDER